jgi:hypothetical protein
MEGQDYLPCRINEAHSIVIEGTIDRIQDCEFTQSLDRAKQHNSDDDEAENKGSWTTGLQGGTRTDEETSTDGTACSKLQYRSHLQQRNNSPMAIICI